MKKLIWITGLILFFNCPLASAHNIQVSNVSLQNVDATAKTIDIKFDLTWENSFTGTDANGKTFYDRAWVFVKFWNNASTVGAVPWQHATLMPGGTLVAYDQTAGVGISADSKGAFCKPGYNQTVRWNYGTDGLTSSANVKVRVMAIEMVYIPQGPFYVGDGSASQVAGQFRNGASTTTPNAPFAITSESAITLGGPGTGNLGNNNAVGEYVPTGQDDFNDTTTKTLPAAFPKGFNAFYIMKYDVSQGQYRDFLNTLSSAQANNRWSLFTTYRYGVKRSGSPAVYYCDLNSTGGAGDSKDGEWLMCNFIGWPDHCAYAAWAGLRPMTELENEKAARGGSPTNNAVPNEYAWGSVSITQATGITNSGANNETATPSNANCVYGWNVGPMRCGVFSASSTTRVQSGASFYGVMDLTGNLTNWCVAVGNGALGTTMGGRDFQGSHGNGTLATASGFEGNALNADWPGYDTSNSQQGVTGVNRVGTLRGGGFTGDVWRVRVSDRWLSTYYPNNLRSQFYSGGSRCVRTEGS